MDVLTGRFNGTEAFSSKACYCVRPLNCLLPIFRWHNIDQAVSCRWSNGRPNKYSLLTAWSFDRVIAPSDLERKDNITVTAVPCSCSVSLTIQLRKNLENMQCCVTRWKKYAIKYFFQFWRAVWGWAAGKPLPPLTEDDRDTTTINTDAFLLRADKVDANGTALF